MRDKQKADTELEGESCPRAGRMESTDSDDALLADADIGLQPLPLANHGGFLDLSSQLPPGNPGAFPRKKTPCSFSLFKINLNLNFLWT